MESLPFIEQNPIPTESELQKFESKFGIKLPMDYRQFLLKHGGGILSDDILVTFKSTDPIDEGVGAMPLRDIYSISAESEYDRLADVLEDYRSVVELAGGDYIKPKEFIPIANNWFGDDYCIGITEPVLGEIYLHIHDFSGVNGIEEDPRYPNFFFIASNLNGLLNSIMTDEEFEEL